MLIVLSDVLVACISAACSQIATCSWCGLQPYRGTALRHCGVQPGMAKPWFKFSAGGLDGAAKTLDELEMVEVGAVVEVGAGEPKWMSWMELPWRHQRWSLH